MTAMEQACAELERDVAHALNPHLLVKRYARRMINEGLSPRFDERAAAIVARFERRQSKLRNAA